MTRFNTKLILRRNILCFNNLQNKTSTHFISLFNYISPSILHLSSMMHRNVVADHSSKEFLLHMLTFFTPPTHDGQHHPSTRWVRRRCQQTLLSSQPASSLVFTLQCPSTSSLVFTLQCPSTSSLVFTLQCPSTFQLVFTLQWTTLFSKFQTM